MAKTKFLTTIPQKVAFGGLVVVTVPEVPDTDYNVVVFENRFPSMVRVPGRSGDVAAVYWGLSSLLRLL